MHLTTVMLAASVASPALAQQPAQTETDLLGATCGDYLAAARLAQPGDKPSKKRRAEAEDAQDALVDAMLWMHGYLTGRAPAGTPEVPLTRSWMAEHVGKLAKACTDSGSENTTRLADVVRRL